MTMKVTNEADKAAGSVSCHAHANCEFCDQLERDLAAARDALKEAVALFGAWQKRDIAQADTIRDLRAGKLNRWIRHDTECPALWSDKNVFGEPRDNQCTCGLDAALAAGEKP